MSKNRKKRRAEKKIQKAQLAESINAPGVNVHIDREDRGINVYNISELMSIQARDKSGIMTSGSVARPIFSLSIEDRNEIFKRSSMFQGVVTGRAKRISGLNWKIKCKTKDHDRLVANLKEQKQVYDELEGSTDVKHIATKFKIRKTIQQYLPDVLDDLSNFDGALRRFNKRNQRKVEDKTDQIEEWLKTPNAHDSMTVLLHKLVVDLMVHGSVGIYKDMLGGRLENFYVLPGGTIFPFRSPHVGGPSAYFQIIPSLEAKLYYEDEMAFISYVPNSWSSYGEVPLEALINKVAETLLFDARSAEQADGTTPPQKAVIFSKTPSPLGGLTSSLDFDLPMPDAEQKRIETALNEARKEAIKTLSGVGTPTVIDLSKSDTFSQQQQRQDKLLRDMALILNMSNTEVNLFGGEFTSGKESSSVQKEIDQEKGVGPILKSIQELFTRKIIPYRFGFGHEFEFDVEPSEAEQVELEQKKMNTGTYSVNRIREDRGDDAWPEPEYDRPQKGQGSSPDGSTANPLNMRAM